MNKITEILKESGGFQYCPPTVLDQAAQAISEWSEGEKRELLQWVAANCDILNDDFFQNNQLLTTSELLQKYKEQKK